ncbi:aldehyde dehydrogenase family protein [Pseudomonas abieticivorans]|uniref:aldehyde dehydrogenase family protein n=1 Tax=Pseudomonas abieticivorans TaxID=2931382 RepID=UPI0020BD7A55|nr:aldehyde dehydrogenase family protein [Pseudomonas sp. PIA16]
MNAPQPVSSYALSGDQYINGRWQAGRSSRRLDDRDPYTGQPLLEMAMASVADVDQAYRAAEQAQVQWATCPATQKTALLNRLATIIERRSEEITAWLIRESGSTRIKAGFECANTANLTRECAAMPFQVEGRILTSHKPGEQSFVFREPLGVVGVISPWNFPLYLSMRSVVPAIALGNTVVLKPASDTAVTGGLLIAHLFEEAGFPAGVLNVVVGAGSEIGDAFVEHPVPRFISFTGSTEVGRSVGRAATGGAFIKRVALELGGNSPLVVLDDADVEQAAHAAVVGRFLHQGQICMSVNRIIVDRSVYARFAELVAERVGNLKVGDPNDPDTVIGPVINEQQLRGLLGKVERATAAGLQQIAGGPAAGLLLPPHVFGQVPPSHELAAEETFGPILPLVVAQDERHALELANAGDYGLSSAVFTQDMARGLGFARQIVAGMTHINDITVDDQPNAPFGGEKNSGLGRFNGHYALDEFTRAHWVTWRAGRQQYPF